MRLVFEARGGRVHNGSSLLVYAFGGGMEQRCPGRSREFVVRIHCGRQNAIRNNFVLLGGCNVVQVDEVLILGGPSSDVYTVASTWVLAPIGVTVATWAVKDSTSVQERYCT